MGYRSVLRAVAEEFHGFVTTSAAAERGVPPVELRRIAAQGGLVRVDTGVYRFPGTAPGRRARFAEATLRAGGSSFLALDSVLALHDLGGLRAPRVRVGTLRPIRRPVPSSLEVVPVRVDADELVTYWGIRSTSVARALLDCRSFVPRERLVDAAREATRRRLLTERDLGTVRRGLLGRTG